MSSKGGGQIPPPSDVSPTEKHADVTRVKTVKSKEVVCGIVFILYVDYTCFALGSKMSVYQFKNTPYSFDKNISPREIIRIL